MAFNASMPYDDFPQFQAAHREWVETALTEKGRQRETRWSESIAVGSRDYITRVGEALGSLASGRKARKVAEGWEQRETRMSYKADFGGPKWRYRQSKSTLLAL